MPKSKTRIWDPAEHLTTEEDMADFLDVAQYATMMAPSV